MQKKSRPDIIGRHFYNPQVAHTSKLHPLDCQQLQIKSQVVTEVTAQPLPRDAKEKPPRHHRAAFL
jgi:hypothetical protein